MALSPLIEVCATKGCKGISIKDVTGIYDVTDNPTGWNSPNLSPSDDDFNATVTIVNNGSTYTFDVTDDIPDPIYGSFYIPVEQVLVDGVSTVTYTVSGTINDVEVSYSKSVSIFTYCTVRCCVYKKMQELVDMDTCKDSSKVLPYLYMWGLFERMRDLASGCDLDAANDILSQLNRQCGVSVLQDCGCS
jgi:hypothetical protein